MVFYARQILNSEQTMAACFADLTQQSAGILRMGFSHQRSSGFFQGYGATTTQSIKISPCACRRN